MSSIFYGLNSVALRQNSGMCCFVVGFLKKFPFWLSVYNNLKNKPCFSMLDGMPMVSAIFPTGSKMFMFVHNIGDE
jgi:hypothetical protein